MGKITKNDIISFEMVVKLTYKDCEVTAKRNGQFLEVQVANFSGKGYFTEKSETFICDGEYPNLLNYLNNNIHYIEEVYEKTIEANTRNDDKIRDFKEYEK